MKTYAQALANTQKSEYYHPNTNTWSVVSPPFDSRKILEQIVQAGSSTSAQKEEEVSRKRILSPVGVVEYSRIQRIAGINLGPNVKIFSYKPLSVRGEGWPALAK